LKKKQGLTYIEIILGVAIITYIFLSFVQIIINISVLSHQDEMRDVAQNLAVNIIEEMKSQPFESLENKKEEYVFKGRKFELIVFVEDIIYKYLKKIDVKVLWKEKNSINNYELVTYRANY